MATSFASTVCKTPHASVANGPEQRFGGGVVSLCSVRSNATLLARRARQTQSIGLILCRAATGGAADIEDDWTTQYVKGDEELYNEVAAPEFKLRFLWLPKNVAVGVDQVFAGSFASPLTEFFFWPRKDAWEELKSVLEAKTWISERDSVLLLNRTTEVINYWQEEGEKHSVEEARQMFPDCEFLSA
jgi:30S ribosomal protein 3